MMINEKPIRPSYRTYFINICNVVASRSTCMRHHVGAIITKDKRILSTGYNGAPVGLPHCIDIGCPRKDVPSGTMHELCRAVHAEQNAIIQAALHGVSTKGATLYCTHQPCILCSKMIINAGIVEVVYKTGYDEKTGLEMLRQSGLSVSQYNHSEEINTEPALVDHPYYNEKIPHDHTFFQYDDTESNRFEQNNIHHIHKFVPLKPYLMDVQLDPSVRPKGNHKYILSQLNPSVQLIPRIIITDNCENEGMIDCQNVPIPAWKRVEIRRMEE